MPRKTVVLPSWKPRSLPPFTCTTGGFIFGESAAFRASLVFAPNAGAGSSAILASAPPTTAAPLSTARRFIDIDPDDSRDFRLRINPLTDGRGRADNSIRTIDRPLDAS